MYFAHEYVFGLNITSGSIRLYLNRFDAVTKYVHSDEILFCRQIRPAEMEVSEGCFEHNVQHSCAGEAWQTVSFAAEAGGVPRHLKRRVRKKIAENRYEAYAAGEAVRHASPQRPAISQLLRLDRGTHEAWDFPSDVFVSSTCQLFDLPFGGSMEMPLSKWACSTRLPQSWQLRWLHEQSDFTLSSDDCIFHIQIQVIFSFLRGVHLKIEWNWTYFPTSSFQIDVDNALRVCFQHFIDYVLAKKSVLVVFSRV